MDNSVYVALSKQVAMQRQLNSIANNIANANTGGFKTEQMLFKQYLVADAENRETAYTQDFATIRDTSQGRMQQTDSQLDFAINGKGYFAVQTATGTAYTRAGNFTIDADGALANSQGYKVLDDAGAPIEFEEDDQQIVVFADGRIEVDGEERNNLGVYQFDNENLMARLDGGLYTTNQDALPNEGEGRVAQGFIELSNAQPIREINNLIELQRHYEGAARFISSMYEIQEDTIRRISRPA